MKDFKILDCTIRDGGHLNDWRFDPDCVKASYDAAVKSGVDYFEIGYRMPSTVANKGEFAYCLDDFLKSLIPNPVEDCKIVLMIDAGKSDQTLFVSCTPAQTIVSGVRVAAYPYELEKAVLIVEALHGMGYEVFLNLMASSELAESHYDFLKAWQQKHILNAICFADSFGAFIPKDITRQIGRLKACGYERIGFHGHNNLQMAFANTLQAISDGIKYVDASIYGMGRGSGNLPMEVLIGFMEKEGNTEHNTVPLLSVIERFYLDLFKTYDWGYKTRSLLGGLKNVHPYYVDEIYKSNTYTIEEIWNVLDRVKDSCPISYSTEKLNMTLEGRFYTPITPQKAREMYNKLSDQLNILPAEDAFVQGKFELQDRYKGRKFLILANGSSLVNSREKILAFSRQENCILIGVNYLQALYEPQYHVFVNRKRFAKYVNTMWDGSSLIVPSFFGRRFVEEYYSGRAVTFVDVEHAADMKDPPLQDSTQKILNLNVAIVAILCAYQMGAKEIYAVGIDGYMADTQQKELEYFYNENDVPEDKNLSSIRYEKFAQELGCINGYLLSKSVPFSIITPTSHKQYYKGGVL